MTNHEQRKYTRTESHNLISYVCLDENGNPAGQGMGRTLNISESGILLETYSFIDPQYIMSFTINLEDEMIDIRGKIVYYKKRDNKRFEYGVQFIDTTESKKRTIKQFVVMYKDETM